MTQAHRVLDWLESGKTITTLDSFRDLGITRLAARIYELKKEGHTINKRTFKVINRWSEECHIAEYFIDEDEGEDETLHLGCRNYPVCDTEGCGEW